MIKSFKQLSLILLSTFLFTACSIKEPTAIIPKTDDLTELSKTANDDFLDQEKATKDYFDKYFKPWNSSKVSYSRSEAMWGQSYKYKKVYLENHNLATAEWFDKQINNSNFDAYNLSPKKAITLENVNVRVLPTNSVMFYDPKTPGEGFPFDYNQNSALKINTPIIVSHLSKDRAWAFIESGIVGGWVEIKNIAFVDDKFIKEFKTSNYYVTVKEKFPIYEPIFREYVKVGTIFPKKNNYFIIAKKDDEAFMVMNRNYELEITGGTSPTKIAIGDLSTYIDPVKFNYIFADTSLEAMNFWIQTKFDIKARRLISAKQIPNL